jgi:transposase InsO family protein
MSIRRVVPDISSEALEESRDFYQRLGLVEVMNLGWVMTLQYTARAFQAACQRVGIAQVDGAPRLLDNAVIESWHSTLEFELRRKEHFATKAPPGPRWRPGSRTTTPGGGTRPARECP